MIIKFQPIRSPEAQISYGFDGDVLTVTASTGASEVYDFEGLPDGRAENISAGSLPLAGVLEAERVDGILRLHLLLTRGRYAPAEVIAPLQSYDVASAQKLLLARDNFPDPEQMDEESEDD